MKYIVKKTRIKLNERVLFLIMSRWGSSLHCTWDGVLGVDGAAGGEGDGGRVALFVLLPPPVEEQQHQQQHHQDDQHHDATDGPPRLLLPRRQGNHDAAGLLRRV